MPPSRFPGVSYLAALDRMAKLGYRDRRHRRGLVIAFCLIQQLLLELPLIGYAVAPDWTAGASPCFRGWIEPQQPARPASTSPQTIGALLLLRGVDHAAGLGTGASAPVGPREAMAVESRRGQQRVRSGRRRSPARPSAASPWRR